jgi:anti-sigma regulatory factor (Ser/Thr protein kinase)
MQHKPERELIFELKIPAKADRLALVRAIVQRAVENAGCNTELAQKLVIGINEACMNIIQHAYGGDSDNEMELVILKGDGKLYFNLIDQADHIDLDKVKSRDLDDIRPGGVGVHFIHEIMDEFKMGHLPDNNKGNFLELIKSIE